MSLARIEKDMSRLYELTRKCTDGWKRNELPPYLTDSEVKELEDIKITYVDNLEDNDD